MLSNKRYADCSIYFPFLRVERGIWNHGSRHTDVSPAVATCVVINFTIYNTIHYLNTSIIVALSTTQ